MPLPQVVLDTNVLVAALRSRRGASYELMRHVGGGLFDIAVSVNVFFEYEASCRRTAAALGLPQADVDALLALLRTAGRFQLVYFTIRPYLSDPDDDMILELAVNAGADTIVTYNRNDLRGSERLGVRAVTAAEFLRELGVIP